MPSTIRILMICPQFKPIVGGYERAAERLSTELVRQGNEVTVITERRDRAWAKKETITGIDVRRMWCIYRPGWHVITSMLSFGCYLLFKGWRYQIFHVHQYGYHAALTVALGKLMHRPVVLKLTNTSEHGVSKALEQQNPLSRKVLAFLHRHVDACVAPSKAAAEEALKFGIPPQIVHLIGNGVDTKEFVSCSEQDKKDLKIKLELSCELMILYVGRLTSEKNPRLLLEAWSKIKTNFPIANLVFIGEGPESPLLKELVVTFGCVDTVVMAGQREDVLKWYQAADIYVLSSNLEGLSNSLLEAMSCNLATVSTRVSGSEDIFEQADIGNLVEIGDIDGLASGIKVLLEDKKRRITCGIKARNFVEAHYSLDAVARDVASVYQLLLRDFRNKEQRRTF